MNHSKAFHKVRLLCPRNLHSHRRSTTKSYVLKLQLCDRRAILEMDTGLLARAWQTMRQSRVRLRSLPVTAAAAADRRRERRAGIDREDELREHSVELRDRPRPERTSKAGTMKGMRLGSAGLRNGENLEPCNGVNEARRGMKDHTTTRSRRSLQHY